MNPTSDFDAANESFQCPTCGYRLPYQVATFPFDSPCPDCGCLPWCRVTKPNGAVVLEVLPRRTPEIEDIGRFVEHHLRSDPSAHVICDLHALDSLDTILLARLVALNKRIRSTGGRLTLRGMRPVVREVFLRLALDRVFEIADDEPEPFGAGQ